LGICREGVQGIPGPIRGETQEWLATDPWRRVAEKANPALLDAAVSKKLLGMIVLLGIGIFRQSQSMRRKWLVSICLVTAAFCYAGCNDKNDSGGESVVLYSSVDESYTREVIREFEKETGIHVKLVSDSEAAKSTGLVNRLLAEKERPVADIFWSGDPIRAERLEMADVGTCWQHGTGDQDGVAWRLRMIIVNRQHENKSLPRPESVLDLAKPEYASKSCLANPQFGTTSMHLALIYELWGEDVARKFLSDFTANGGTMVASNGEVRRRVSSGEFTYGLTDSDDVSVALADGKPVDYIAADASGKGAVGIPTRVVVIKNAPHAETAHQLAAFLSSDRTEDIMARSDAAHFPVLEGVTSPDVFPFRLEEVNMAKYSMADVVSRMESIQSEIDLWVADQQR
jgi:iron(III) transport system substrate-binding protein